MLASLELQCAAAQEYSMGGTDQSVAPKSAGSAPAVVAKTGTLTGQFVYGGPPPKASEINSSAFDMQGRPRETSGAELIRKYKPVDESLLVSKNGGLANVFVWVRSKEIPAPPSEKLEPVIVEFKQGHLCPHALAFEVPRQLILKNLEPVERCNVKAELLNNSPFNVLIPPLEQRKVSISRSEPIPAHLTGNVEPWLSGWILPLPHSYFAISDKDGRFRIESLPPG